jgi:NifU-like protein involved in Fe-S cluster formation
MRLAATASLLAEKLRGGAVAEAIDLDALEPVVTQLRGEYSQQQRVQQLVAMFEQARRMTSQK